MVIPSSKATSKAGQRFARRTTLLSVATLVWFMPAAGFIVYDSPFENVLSVAAAPGLLAAMFTFLVVIVGTWLWATEEGNGTSEEIRLPRPLRLLFGLLGSFIVLMLSFHGLLWRPGAALVGVSQMVWTIVGVGVLQHHVRLSHRTGDSPELGDWLWDGGPLISTRGKGSILLGIGWIVHFALLSYMTGVPLDAFGADDLLYVGIMAALTSAAFALVSVCSSIFGVPTSKSTESTTNSPGDKEEFSFPDR